MFGADLAYGTDNRLFRWCCIRCCFDRTAHQLILWGGAAIAASMPTMMPPRRPTFVALGSYAAIWIVFNISRAIADSAHLAVAAPDAVQRLESSLFGGQTPSARLQTHFHHGTRVGALDIAMALVYVTFFIAPHVTAIVLWFRHRSVFRSYFSATIPTFALGMVGFLLLPTTPPWMADPGRVNRLTELIARQKLGIAMGGGQNSGGYGFEPNDLAAMPSIHVAAIVLIFLAVRRFGPIWALAGFLHAVAMSVAVIYLGEHYVIDVAAGWVVALAGWFLASHAFPALDVVSAQQKAATET